MPSGTSRVRKVLHLLGGEATAFIRLRIATLLILVVIAAILTALGPIALKLIVDGFTGQHHQVATSPLLLVSLYIVSQWIARVTSEVRALIYRRIQRRMLRTLSERLFAHVMHLPFRFHLNRQTGAVSETLTNGLEGFQLVLHHLVLTVLPVTAELITVIVILGRLAPPVFLLLFLMALILYGSAFAYYAATLGESARIASEARVEAGAAITDGLLNYETVKYFNAETIVQQKVGTALAGGEKAWLEFSCQLARNGLLAATIFAAFLGGTVWFATLEVSHHHMTVGDFVLVNSYMLQLAQPIETLGAAMQGFSQGFAMLEKLVNLLSEAPERSPRIRTEIAANLGMLEFRRVTLSYFDDRPVLCDVSFQLAPNHTLGIVGPSGSGKSTIVRLLTRLLEPDKGHILLDGEPICRLSLSRLRNAIAVVPQDTVLFNDTILYNIAFGRAGASLAEIHQAARLAHLHDFVMSLPDGYDTQVGERGMKLSGGEKQRVSIARAILKSPRVYVFDEATSSLDSHSERDIVASLREIAKQSTTVLIAHRLSTVIHADEIVVLENSRIIERGTHTQLVDQNGSYATLWRAQQCGSAAA